MTITISLINTLGKSFISNTNKTINISHKVSAMMFYRILFITLIFTFIHRSTTSTPCCKGQNLIVNKRCIDGSSITGISCPQRYLANSQKDESMRVDENGNLKISEFVIPTDRYCIARLNYSDTDNYLICFEDEETEKFTIFTLEAILELISVFFITITIAIYSQVTELLDLQGICIIHSISGLAISYTALAITQLKTTATEPTLCLTSAYIIYFSMLYAFFWLNALSFHIWRTIVNPGCLKRINKKSWLGIYHVFGIGSPFVCLVILVIAHHSPLLQFHDIHPGLAEVKCWFKSTKAQFVYFYSPMAVLLGLNIIYYGWTIRTLWKNLAKTDEKRVKILKYRFVLCVKLFFIMGISWIFELLSAALQNVPYAVKVLWVATDCFNTLQGILIFLILVVLRKRVIRGLANRSFCGTRLPSRWRTVADDECDEIEEEFKLSQTEVQKV